MAQDKLYRTPSTGQRDLRKTLLKLTESVG